MSTLYARGDTEPSPCFSATALSAAAPVRGERGDVIAGPTRGEGSTIPDGSGRGGGKEGKRSSALIELRADEQHLRRNPDNESPDNNFRA